MVSADDASVAICQCRPSFGTVGVVNSGMVKLINLSGTDFDLRLNGSMDGPSNAIGHLERAGAINLSDVDEQTGIVENGWNE